jgi:pilin isopeptide linkage protein
MMPTSAFAATYTRSTELAVPVTHTLEGDTPADKLAFEFSITPVEEGDPVPAASTITVENPGGPLEDSFDAITYTKPGDYDYILSQVEGNTEGVTYDNSQYYVRVSVRYDQGELKPWVKGYKIDTSSAGSYAANADDADDADGKVAAFVFRNTYTEPKSEEPTTPEEPVTPDEPTESEVPETPAVSEVPTTSTVEPTTSTVESTTTETTVKKATSVSAVTTKTTTTTSTVPETGDNTHLTLLITLSLISCVIVIIGLGWILPRQKKH